MGVRFVNLRLTIALLFVLMAAPLLGLQIITWSNAPWWKLPTEVMAKWTIGLCLFLIPTLVAIRGARAGAFPLLRAFALLWIVASVGLLIAKYSTELAMVTLVVAGFWLSALSWIYFELKRSYFDPGLQWFEGAPQTIPELIVEIDSTHYAVSRLDREGMFVFPQGGKPRDEKRVNAQIRFVDRTQQGTRARYSVQLQADVVRKSRAQGRGLRFYFQKADERKRLGDLVERVKANGFSKE